MKVFQGTSYKGTRILFGNEKRETINKLVNLLRAYGCDEISFPVIQYAETFKDKVGAENNNLMYNFTDRGNRDLCLAPEYTAVVQPLTKTRFKFKDNVKLFYIQECFRGEKPQAGRYRQFTQVGVEIINPTKDFTEELSTLAESLVWECLPSDQDFNVEVNMGTTRGLDYYKEGKGFEITVAELGSSKQVVGGGEYENGIGFALGLDRILSLRK
tara:strand:- start:29973 stop:30614 length:642 start_codon:yes stop_codon:yes gene_type:complete